MGFLRQTGGAIKMVLVKGGRAASALMRPGIFLPGG